MNTDGSSQSIGQTPGRPQQGPSGYGGILRDNDGSWIRGFIGFIGESDGLTSELYGILKGLEMLVKLNLKGSVLETDCKAALEWVTREDGRLPKMGNVLDENISEIITKCRQLIDENNIDIKLVSEDANRCADKLAKMAVAKRLSYKEYDFPPDDQLRNLVAKDAKFIG